jgi:hypothetical protein
MELFWRIGGHWQRFDMKRIEALGTIGSVGTNDNLMSLLNGILIVIQIEIDASNCFVNDITDIIIARPDSFPGTLGVVFLKQVPLYREIVLNRGGCEARGVTSKRRDQKGICLKESKRKKKG